MNRRFILIIIIITSSTTIWASPPPCTKWQVKVGAHDIQAYQRKDGTPVKGSDKNIHCRHKFPKVQERQERFTDQMPTDWPLPSERFKPWTQLEKEILLKWLSEQPRALRELKGITFLRGPYHCLIGKIPEQQLNKSSAMNYLTYICTIYEEIPIWKSLSFLWDREGISSQNYMNDLAKYL